MDAHGQGFHHVRTQPLQQQGGRLPVTTQGEKMVETGHLRRKHMAGGQTAHMTGDHPFPAGTPETQSSVRSRQMAVEIEQHLVPYRGKKIFFRCLQDEWLCLSVELPATGISFEQMGKLPQVLFFLGFPVCHDVPSHSKNIGGSSPSRKGAPAVAAVRPGSRRAAGAVPCPCWHMCGKGRQGTRPGGRIESALRTFHLMEYRKIFGKEGRAPKRKRGLPVRPLSRWRRGGLVPQR